MTGLLAFFILAITVILITAAAWTRTGHHYRWATHCHLCGWESDLHNTPGGAHAQADRHQDLYHPRP